MVYQIDKTNHLYPIVYVRGFAPTMGGGRDAAFHDAYYGFAETAVDPKQAPPTRTDGTPGYLAPDIFEGLLVRLMKEHGYVDAFNGGLTLYPQVQNPTRSIWICRFYDQDFLQNRIRPIEDHAEELRKLVCDQIPFELKNLKDNQGNHVAVDLGGPDDSDYKVILVAHSMGGLVCRCLIQNLLPNLGQDPRRWIHRFVTMATPHKGIDLGAIPDFVQRFVVGTFNPLDASMFQEPRMRDYLNLDPSAPLNSLNSSFPTGRCFCLIGSDHRSYGFGQEVTGSHSDGLVKQDRAYIEGAYFANVHRSHSGYRGIVNSYESYENIRRFLFGDTKAEISLENIQLNSEGSGNAKDFYDFEFRLTVRSTGVYLHQRRQDPCENAFRYQRSELPTQLILHTGFLNSRLRLAGDPFSYFQLSLRAVEHRIIDGWLWDREYPERTIYSETLEIRLGNPPDSQVEYRWLSDTVEQPADWQQLQRDGDGIYPIPLRQATTLSALLCIKPGTWPDATCED